MAWVRVHDYLWACVEGAHPVRVRFAGDLDVATTPAAEAAFEHAVARSGERIAIDLSRVLFLDARGLSALLRMRNHAAVEGRRLVLDSPSRAVLRLLELADVCSSFEMVPRSLGTPRAMSPHTIEVLSDVLERAIALDQASRGTAQLVDPETGALVLVATPGFSTPFVSFFETVHDATGASCGAAAASSSVVPIHDVTASSIFLETPSLDVMVDAGARSCISIPVVAPNGDLVAMFSTHHERAREWSADRIRALQALAAGAARELVGVTAASPTDPVPAASGSPP